jgi:hypothetical protein
LSSGHHAAQNDSAWCVPLVPFLRIRVVRRAILCSSTLHPDPFKHNNLNGDKESCQGTMVIPSGISGNSPREAAAEMLGNHESKCVTRTRRGRARSGLTYVRY